MRQAGIIIVASILMAFGCHRKKPTTALPPPPRPPVASAPVTIPPDNPRPLPAPSLPPTPAPAPATVSPPVVNPLEQADNAFNAGSYVEAARGYEAYLQRYLNGDRRDQALFRLALTMVVSTNPVPDWTKMTALLKQLVDQYPQSPLKGAAMAILSLATDTQKRELRIKQLNTELERLKQIDADRKKRP